MGKISWFKMFGLVSTAIGEASKVAADGKITIEEALNTFNTVAAQAGLNDIKLVAVDGSTAATIDKALKDFLVEMAIMAEDGEITVGEVLTAITNVVNKYEAGQNVLAEL